MMTHSQTQRGFRAGGGPQLVSRSASPTRSVETVQTRGGRAKLFLVKAGATREGSAEVQSFLMQALAGWRWFGSKQGRLSFDLMLVGTAAMVPVVWVGHSVLVKLNIF